MHEMSALKLADCRDVADLGLRLKDLNDKLLTMAGGAGEPTADVHLIMNFIQNLGSRYRFWKEDLLRGHRLVSDIPQDPTVLRFNDVFVKALMQEQIFDRVDRALEGEPVIDITDDSETSAEGVTMKARQEYEEAKYRLREDPDALKKLIEDHERTMKKFDEKVAKKQATAPIPGSRWQSSLPPIGKNGMDISEPLARTKASMALKMHEAMKQLEAFKQMQLEQQEPAATAAAAATAAKTKNKAKGKQEPKQTQPQTQIQNTPSVSSSDQTDSTELLKSVEAAANAAESAARRHAEMLRSFMASTSQNGHR